MLTAYSASSEGKAAPADMTLIYSFRPRSGGGYTSYMSTFILRLLTSDSKPHILETLLAFLTVDIILLTEYLGRTPT